MAQPRAINLPPAVLGLAVAFAAVHLIRQVLSADQDSWVLLAFAFIPDRYDGYANELPGGIAACIWSPLTYAFLHADAVHLTVNLIWMASFGTPLARRLGSARFLLLAAVASAAGALAQYILQGSEEGIMIGASGAISGMTAATARFAFAPGGPLSGARHADVWVEAEPLTTVLTRSRALVFIVIWFAANVLFGLASPQTPMSSGPIAWAAHLGGFLAGLLLFPLFDRRPPAPGDTALEAEA